MKHLIKLLELLTDQITKNKLRQLLMLIALVLFMPGITHAVTLGTLDPDIKLPSLTGFTDIKSITASPIPKDRETIRFAKTSKKQPIVRLYLSESCPAGIRLKKQLICVPQIEFIEKAPEEWVDSCPVLHWQGDKGQWWTMGNNGEGVDLQAFVTEYNSTNPSQKQVAFDVLAAKDIGYPIRGNYWSVGSSWNPSRSQVIYHLLYGGQHSGKFSKSYLDKLSWNELQSLHSDDHEANVKWASVQKVGPARTTKKTTAPKSQNVSYQASYQQYAKPRRAFKRRYRFRSGCPSGSCPL